MDLKGRLFTDMFEPKKLEHFALPKRIISEFPDGEIPNNFIFSGVAGCGKSSLAQFLAKSKNFMYINSSLDTGIDTLREGGRVYSFCSEFSFEDTQKVILFDEIDGVSDNFFEALKGFYDTFKGSVRFLATTNHVERIPTAILSRFSLIDYSFEDEDEEKEWFGLYRARVFKIMRALKMEISPDNLTEFSKRYFPDFRYPLQTLQKLHINGVTIIDETIINKKSFEYHELYSMMLTMSESDNRTLHTAITAIPNPASAIRTIDRELMDYMERNTANAVVKYGAMTITIAKYNNMLNNKVDPMLCLKALIFELILIVRR